MLKDRLLSFLENEDGHVDYEPMMAIFNGITALYVVLLIETYIYGKSEVCTSPAYIVGVCVAFASLIWFTKNPEVADTEYVIMFVLTLGVIAGLLIYMIAERVWKMPEAGIVPAWIMALYVIAMIFRYLLSASRKSEKQLETENENRDESVPDSKQADN